MARFTNFATLTYTGGTTDSNTVVGEILETLTMTKTAVGGSYTADGDVTYVVSIVNSGSAAATGLTVTDNLGGYTFGTGTVHPLAYVAGSLLYYVNGTIQTAPTITAGPPLTISGISVPAGGNAVLVYEASVTDFAPMGETAAITNTATVTGGGLTTPLTDTATVNMTSRVELRIRKALSPTTVSENGQLTYTFVIENDGALPADASDRVVLTDTFDPRLSNLTVTFNGTAWTQGTNYTYAPDTGLFTTVAGQITVPAATFTQNADGTYTTTPGTATLVVTGTV